ncbi:hypothetical protein M569_13494, partial [Genlisea aurea]
QPQEDLLAALLEQQQIDKDRPVIEDDDDEDEDDDDEDEDDDDEDDDEEGDDDDEDDDEEGDDEDAASGKSKQSRSEKKSRKAMLKLGMKPVTGVSRVTVKKSKNVSLSTLIHAHDDTHSPIDYAYAVKDVKKRPNSDDTCVIVGEVMFEYLSSQLQSQAAQQFKAPPPISINNPAVPKSSEPSSAVEEEDEEEVDETGVEPKDVELVMTHAFVSKARAVKALRDADGDVVSAILELT